MSSVIEQAARALWEYDQKTSELPRWVKWDRTPTVEERDRYREAVRVVMRSVREPSLAMSAFGSKYWATGSATAIWRAMVDELVRDVP